MSDFIVNEQINQIKSLQENHDSFTLEDIKAGLKKYWANRIAAIWHIDDVIHTSREIGYDNNKKPELTEEQAKTVLHHMGRKHDASLGINWDTIECWIDELCGGGDN